MCPLSCLLAIMRRYCYYNKVPGFEPSSKKKISLSYKEKKWSSVFLDVWFTPRHLSFQDPCRIFQLHFVILYQRTCWQFLKRFETYIHTKGPREKAVLLLMEMSYLCDLHVSISTSGEQVSIKNSCDNLMKLHVHISRFYHLSLSKLTMSKNK